MAQAQAQARARARACSALCVATALLAVLPRAAGPAPAPHLPAPTCAPLCHCHADHISCNLVPFHRFPQTNAGVRHVSVTGARLGALGAAALDARALRTLVLVACRLHSIEQDALASMVQTLASLDLGHNDFTEVPAEALRDLKVLNWLNLQNNRIADLEPEMEWGFLAESLSSLSLGNNQLCSLGAGALTQLRQLAQLDLEGNRLLALSAHALPPSVALLRLSDNLLPALPCAALAQLPRLRHLHLRGNSLRAALNASCHAPRLVLDSLDLAQNELDDAFALDLQPRPPLRRLILDLNDLTAIPPWVLDAGAHLERLSLSHNRLARISTAAVHALHSLARLDLDRNELEVPPVALRALLQLRHLDLAYNRLRELPAPPPHLHYLSLAGNYFLTVPDGLSELADATLVYLDLGYNRISELSADAFGAWSEALGTLNLRGNRLVRIAANSFPPTLPLRELVLSFNDMYRVEPGVFSNLTALQLLELSSTLFGGEFPTATADNVSWLSLDNNNIHRVSPDDLLSFPSLEYLNLDFNKIIDFPGEALGTNGSRLRELRLSYNYLNEIRSGFLQNSPELQSVDLSYNRIRNVSARAFSSLPALQHLSLAGNLLTHLTPRALLALPRLEALDLHDNRLAELSLASFERVASAASELSLNVSRNRIVRLSGGAAAVPLTVLDLEHNLLESLEPAFFARAGPHLRRLALSHNQLASLDALGPLPRLLVLSLSDNGIVAVKRRALADAPALQALDLSRNALQQLAGEQFRGLRHLRHLRLAGNRLRALPRDCLRDTVLEHLDLADNQLPVFPQTTLAAVGFTLRLLSLARNRLEHLDAAMFRACAELRELSLAGNRLTVLADNVLAPLTRLRALDLSSNRIKANFKELLHAVPRLRSLALADADLRAAPALPLPELVELDLSGNRLAALREGDARRLERLRTMTIAGNSFTSLRPTMWAGTPRLATLDASANPIVRLARGALEGLPRLRSLRLERLRRLEALEPRAFRPLVALRDLTLESPPTAGGRGGASVADVVAFAPSLEALTLVVREETLDVQLHGVRAARLREVEVRGAALQRVEADAFASLGSARALTLRVRGTGVMRLPAALVRPLARVPHLALDFSNNELVEFSPATLYPNLTGWNRVATKLLPGGLVVSGNPLRCGCAVSWVGAWLRRWTAEVGGWTRSARGAARASACVPAGGGDEVPLVSLDEGEAECRASALSSLAPRAAPPLTRPPHLLPAFLWMVLVYSVS